MADATSRWHQIAERLDGDTLRSVVRAAGRVVDVIAEVRAERAAAAAPQPIDYATAGPDRSPPPGGWIDSAELRQASVAVSEAIAAERWASGFVAAVRLFALVGAI